MLEYMPMPQRDDGDQSVLYSYAQHLIDEPTRDNLIYIVNKIYSSQKLLYEKLSQIELLRIFIKQLASNDEFLKLCSVVEDKLLTEKYNDSYVFFTTAGGGNFPDDFIFYLISLLINDYTIEQAERVFGELEEYCSSIGDVKRRNYITAQYLFFIISVTYIVLNITLSSIPLKYLINKANRLTISN